MSVKLAFLCETAEGSLNRPEDKKTPKSLQSVTGQG